MKSTIFSVCLLMCFSVFAGRPSSGAPVNKTVRCKGINEKRVPVGIDIELDPVDRLVSVTSWESTATFPMNLAKDLGAPSTFLKTDINGKIESFGFKSFNDGLEESLMVVYVPSSPHLTLLMLKDNAGLSYLAKGDVRCDIL